MSDWQHYMLMQLNNDLREVKSDVKSLRSRFEELTTWAQRLCLLVLLWGAGILANAKPETIGEVVGALAKSLR